MAVDRIVVGIDDSKDSHAALRFAAEEAKLRGATLEVVVAYPSPTSKAAFPAIPTGGQAAKEIGEQRRAAAEQAIQRAIDDLGDLAEGVKIEANPLERDRASSALIERSGEADLAVVAHRGRGGFRGLRLGSTSEQVARHARCPVIVVRPNTA